VLERYSASVVRGESLAVSGSVRSVEGPAAGALVTLWLRGGALPRPHRLGQATSGPDGRFASRLNVPTSVPTGDYVIVARAEARE
jgi:hypothetical protein